MTVVVVVVVAAYDDDSTDDDDDDDDDDDGWCRCSDTIPVALATPFVALVRLCGMTILISRVAISLSLSLDLLVLIIHAMVECVCVYWKECDDLEETHPNVDRPSCVHAHDDLCRACLTVSTVLPSIEPHIYYSTGSVNREQKRIYSATHTHTLIHPSIHPYRYVFSYSYRTVEIVSVREKEHDVDG